MNNTISNTLDNYKSLGGNNIFYLNNIYNVKIRYYIMQSKIIPIRKPSQT